MWLRLALAVVATPFGPFREAEAKPAGKLRKITRSRHGVTFEFRLKNAPFPAPGSRFVDDTVLVFVPHHYRLPKSRQVDMVVHFHGHNNTARRGVERHQLREQLYDSKQNAILVAPQGPYRASDSSGGKLERAGGLKRLLDELLRELTRRQVNRALKRARLAGAKGSGMVCLSAHSGGYRVAAACARRGGVDVSEIYLFDALYGELSVFHRWVTARKDRSGRARHKLVSHYASAPVRANNHKLMKRLRRAGVPIVHERRAGELTRAQMTTGRAVFIASPLAHGHVTFAHNGLRDCLFASGFRRRLRSNWFARKHQARTIDRR